MSLAVLPLHYLYWHYLLAWRDGWRIYADLSWFVSHFFSIGTLIKTWWAPWRRLGETYEGGLDLNAWFSALIVNVLMRVVGVVARTVLIIVGVITWLLVLVAALIMVALWLVLPLAVLGLVAMAVYLLI